MCGAELRLRRHRIRSVRTDESNSARRGSIFASADKLGSHQAAGMDNDRDSTALIDPVESSATGDADDSLGFVRGLAYGLACVVPFWGLVIASAWLVF